MYHYAFTDVRARENNVFPQSLPRLLTGLVLFNINLKGCGYSNF